MMTSRRIVTAALVTVALAAAGCGETTSHPVSTQSPTRTHAAQRQTTKAKAKRHARKQSVAKATGAATATATKHARGTAAAALARLPVKGRAPKTGYSREQFGDGWIDAGGCDTRDRILTRDLTARTYLDDCRVESGTLADPYTGERVHYIRGGASEVDIDHVVALLDAWQKGAQQQALATRVAFANDPLELLAVDAHTNRSKGDGDAATWLPPNKAFRCAYVARQVAVKIKYRLWVTQAEKDAIGRVLATCPGQKLPKSGRRIPRTASHTMPAPTATPSHSATGSGRRSGAGHVYANCTAARAAGVTPILRGTPDYAANPELDRDHDGVACEP
jgi:Excalibur calcium-binding domain/Protein of unknown function (DUF1524)